MSEETRLILEKLDKIDTRLDGVETKLENVETRLDSVETKLENVETRLDGVETRLDKVEKNTEEIQVTLENEIDKKIMIIGEGHLILNRKLDEALQVDAEKEMLLLRVTSLESDVRKIKKKLEETAGEAV